MAFTDNPEYVALVAAVTAAQGAEASATVALNGLGTWIAANKMNPGALQSMADTLTKPTVDLAAAVAANPLPA
jgi:hypothetical protein